MAAYLVFFGIGLAEFAASAAAAGRGRRMRLWAVVAAGIMAGAAAGLAPVRIPAPGFEFPNAGLSVLGAMSGLLFGMLETRGWFDRTWLPFFLTPILGFGLGAVAMACLLAYRLALGRPSLLAGQPWAVGLSFLLVGYLTVFGYTLPRRWFNPYLKV